MTPKEHLIRSKLPWTNIIIWVKAPPSTSKVWSVYWVWLESGIWPKHYRQHQGSIILLINNELNLFLITLHTCASMTKTSAPQCPNSTSESKAGSKKSIWPGKSHICNQGQEQYLEWTLLLIWLLVWRNSMFWSHLKLHKWAIWNIYV